MDELGKALASLPMTLFSPAKMVYISYIILLILEKRTPPCWEFVLVSVLFIAVEIGHNDWLRIRLNNNGEKNRPEWLRPK